MYAHNLLNYLRVWIGSLIFIHFSTYILYVFGDGLMINIMLLTGIV